MRKTIFITEEQANNLQNIFNNSDLDNVSQTFSIDILKSTVWKDSTELMHYCDSCNLLCLGEGADRRVYQIDDEHVLKVEKYVSTRTQNEREVEIYQECNQFEREFLPRIYEWDKKHTQPLWIISEQVLTATYADFQKILGVDFGSYTSSNDITQMKQDLEDYSKYNGKTVNSFSLNLMDFLEAYGEGDIEPYLNIIKNNEWFKELYILLNNGLVSSWELENIENWGLVKRNGKPKLIILDIGI